MTMLTASIWPIIEFGMFYALKVLFRLMDRSFSCNNTLTKCKTVQQYVNLYAGPNYLMHFKYSSIMNMVFVTFMYGLAIPLLFPIATIYFIVMYSVEKLCLTYYFKKPPMFDEKLNESAIGTLKWAPVFMMIFGYWIMGNNQIFNNYVSESVYKTDPITTDHKGYNIRLDVSLPLLIIGVIFFIFIFFNDFLMSLIQKCGFFKEEKEAEVDEKLGTYV